MRVMPLKEFSESYGADISPELLGEINARCGLQANANAVREPEAAAAEAPAPVVRPIPSPTGSPPFQFP
jgi:hypothetical protein